MLDTNDADLVTYALETVISGGTGTNAYIGRSRRREDRHGAELLGRLVLRVHPQLATCVWVGYPQGQVPLEGIEGYDAVFGGTIPR